MLRRYDQNAVGPRNLVLEARDFGHRVGFVVLIEQRQIVVDAHEMHVEFVGCELGQRLGVFPVDRFLAVRAGDHGEMGLRHDCIPY